MGFVPFKDGAPTGAWEIFADGFARVDTIVNTSDAIYRPMGLAEGPDGSLYISESVTGRIWRVSYYGDRKQFGQAELAANEARKAMNHIRNPDPVEDNLLKDVEDLSAETYRIYCGTCHQMNGLGASGRFPPLAGTDWVTGNKDRLIQIVLMGMEGPIDVNGELFNNVMPQHSFMSDQQIAHVLTYIRSQFGNQASAVSPQEVSAVRQRLLPPQ